MSSPQKEEPSRRVVMAAALFIVAEILLASSHRFANGFVLDDQTVIVRGEVIHDPANLPQIWTHHTMVAAAGDAGITQSVDTYRPVPLTTFVFDAAISGREPWMYHLTNLVLHSSCSVLVLLLLLRVLRGESPWTRLAPALYGASLFALQPWNVEAQVWINGRSDPLALLFVLLSVRALPLVGSLPRGLLFALWWSLALLSKETALLLAPAVVFYPGAEGRWPPGRELGRRTALVGGLSSLYLMLRSLALGGTLGAGSPAERFDAMVRLPPLVLTVLRELFVPGPNYLRSLVEELTPSLVSEGLGVLAIVGLLASLVVGRARAPRAVWALLWLGPIAPVAIIATTLWPGFGRYLYMPTLTLAVLAALAFQRVSSLLRDRGGVLSGSSRARLLALAAALHVVVFGVRSAVFTTQFRDTESLYRASIEAAPESSMAYGFLGIQRRRDGHPEEAIALLRTAVAIRPSEARYWLNLTGSLVASGEREAAYATALAGLETLGEVPEAAGLHLYAVIAMPARDPEAAIEHLGRCIELQPSRRDCVRSLATLLERSSPDLDAHQAAWRRYLEAHPGARGWISSSPD